MKWIALVSFALAPAFTVPLASAHSLSKQEAQEIAVDAYVYAYPLVMMELTRRISTNVPAPIGSKAPMNTFVHLVAFPDATFTDVVRPNADTLYSLLWFDVSKEPLLIKVPDSGGRYYLLEMTDMWTDVFASPGTRTTGTGEQLLALAGPGWQGELPPGADLIRTPTATGWIIGRTQTNGATDYDNVHKFQAGLSATPLSAWGTDYKPPRLAVNPEWDMKTPPVEQVDKLAPEGFFALYAELTKANPAHANDYPILHRMRRLGIESGKAFSMASLSPAAQEAVQSAWPEARKRIVDTAPKSGVLVNGWRINLTAVGTYGADYLHRAAVAYFGLGANTVEDAVYPTAFTDVDGEPMLSDNRYIIHFDKDQIPPVNAFWSVTMYNEKQAFAANPINRYAIGDRDKLQFNQDGSLDIYVQRDSPGADKESNWLPAPANGNFTMNMRLYWPKPAVLDGSWMPPRAHKSN